jgi:hypothetical protein
MAHVPSAHSRQDQSEPGSFFLVPVSSVERLVLVIGLFIAFGTSGVVAFFASILAVGGDGSSTGGSSWWADSLLYALRGRYGYLFGSRVAAGWLAQYSLGFIPVLVLFGVLKLRSHSALLTDAFSSLRCACGAAKRGR